MIKAGLMVLYVLLALFVLARVPQGPEGISVWLMALLLTGWVAVVFPAPLLRGGLLPLRAGLALLVWSGLVLLVALRWLLGRLNVASQQLREVR